MYSESHLQELYKAYSGTNSLWRGPNVLGIQQLELDISANSDFKRTITKRIRLGQLVEQFVFNQIETSSQYTLLAENIQIKDNQRTLGELDGILQLKNQLIHLEIVYKFYVYDPKLGDSEIERWIGPNRKDSLIEKLNKLKDRQFPLLRNDLSRNALKDHGINSTQCEQRVLFKAQLFLPYQKDILFDKINPDCVCGCFIHLDQMILFKDHLFYIPSKHDWLLDPKDGVTWISFSEFKSEVQSYMERQQSPLFWKKSPNNSLEKIFLVWW